MSALTNGPPLLSFPPITAQSSNSRCSKKHSMRYRFFSQKNISKLSNFPLFFKPSTLRIRSFQHDSTGSFDAASSKDTSDGQDKAAFDVVGSTESRLSSAGSSFLSKLAILLGIAATITILSIVLRQPNQGSSLGTQFLVESLSSSTLAAPASGFSFNAFGYRVVLPEYAPGWIYFWLLMAAGCGLFISEEALNIWVGISLARLLTLDGTWQSLADSFSRNSPYIISTVLWVYWGVCISDMIPFYLGKLFKRSGASNDVYSKVCPSFMIFPYIHRENLYMRELDSDIHFLKLGIGKEKAMNITRTVQRYGNLVGFVERFSIGVRNPTSFLAGALDISPDCFFAGVCCGGLITLPLQLCIGFLVRERPVFALATVATVVGAWTIFPYAVAALTAIYFYLRNRYSS